MDKYHIYEEIGKGEFSQVFKGREKKKIEYVAIKRVEKSMMSKIVTEVQVMHKLESPHTLRFHDWYETRNNLWLILEYCTGADLESLLKQDGNLPEASVRMFGLDILAGLKYMHTQGMLHCDLRPRNFLVDEYGILKIADFKMARKLPKQPLGDTPLDQRGTPPYMAPELFNSDGVHSFTSDFWALGCVLYELRRGFAPFGNTASFSLPELTNTIRTLEPIDHPLRATSTPVPSMTAKLADLLLWLLEKSPANRCNWAKISVHPFWGASSNPPPNNLPAEPAFDALIKSIEQARSQQFEDASLLEFGLLPSDALIASAAAPQLASAQKPHLPPHASDSTPIRPAAKAEPIELTATKLAQGRVLGSSSAADEAKSSNGASAEAKSAEKPSKQTPDKGAKNTDDSRSTNFYRNDAFESDEPQEKVVSKGIPRSEIGGDAKAIRGETQKEQQLENRSENDQFALAQELVDGTSNKSTMTAESLLMHSSDTQVKPIVGNKAIDVVEKVPFKAAALPFSYLDATEIGKLNASELEGHLTLIYKALQKANLEANRSTLAGAQVTERTHMLAYLCAIAPSAEVANIVLNTNFLQLLLRLVKGPEQKPSSAGAGDRNAALSRAGSAASARVGSAQSSSSSSATGLRVAAATVLASMLRYATFIQHPSAKNKDEHLLPVLIGILKDFLRLDSRLKKRLVSALGETIFYVSSQEGEGAAEKWNVPLAAFSTLIKCLKDDTDEVVRHYAAKTIENVMAQGSEDFKRKLTTVEVASRLLELSQHGRNEAFQSSCGMALSHMLFLVLTMEPRKENTLSSASSASASDRSVRLRGSASPSTPPAAQAGLETGPGSGVRFVARVLEKGGLPAMLETLQDGLPKLQQAYLNIISFLFCSPARLLAAYMASEKGQATRGLDPSRLGDRSNALADSALRSTRLFFLKAPTLVSSLLRLIEQGGSAPVRAKALLLAQLLCSHLPSLLATLSERRLPSALVRLLEPLAVSQRVSRDASALTSTSSYPANAAYSMVRYVLAACLSSSRTLHTQLMLLANEQNIQSNSSRLLMQTPESSPMGRAGSRRVSVGSGVRQASAAATSSGAKARRPPIDSFGYSAASNPSPSSRRNALEDDETVGCKADLALLVSNAHILRAAVSIASQPLLRRLMISAGPEFPLALADVLCALPAARSSIQSTGSAALEQGTEDRHAEEADAVSQVEQAALVALEAVAQVDLLGLDNDNLGGSALGAEKSMGSFLHAVATRLISAAAGLSNHPDGDLRVVVAASLRRMVPACLKTYAISGHNTGSVTPVPKGGSMETDPASLMVSQCLEGVVEHLPALLTDQSPIPQYAVRMLTDAAISSLRVATLIADGLSTRNALPLLIDNLRTQGRDRDPYSDAEVSEQDPQLALLLRCLFERTGSSARLLEADLAGALASAVQIAVQRSASVRSGFKDQVTPLIDLLHVVLHFVIRSLSSPPKESPSNTPSPRQKNIDSTLSAAQQYRKQVSPLRVLCSTLFEVLAAANEELEATIADDAQSTPEGEVPAQLQETVSRCLGILFDLFPDAVLEFLLVNRGPGQGQSPREVLSSILTQAHIDLRLRLRLLKILSGVANVR